MFAAHLAAGLAVGARARRAPMVALLTGAFLPDLFWIAFAAVGLEPAAPGAFFDGWSHSCLSILIEATAFSLCFIRMGREVWLPVWAVVMSHLVLDGIIHPVPITLFPHTQICAPWDLWRWGELPVAHSFSHYWWLQLGLIVILLGVYSRLALRWSPRNLVTAAVLIVLGLHLLV